MKFFYILLFFFALASCSSSSDDVTDDTTDDTTDDSTGGTDGTDDTSADITINYDVAALYTTSSEGVQYVKVEDGATVGPTINLATEFGLNVTENITMEAPFLMFYRSFNVFSSVFFFDTNTNTMDEVSDYFDVEGAAVILGIHPTASKIVVVYFFTADVDGDNGWPVYAHVYDRSSGTSDSVQIASNYLANNSVNANGNYLAYNYVNIDLENMLGVVKLSTLEVLPLISLEDPLTPQGKSFALDNQRLISTRYDAQTVQVKNLNTGTDGPIYNTLSYVGGDLGRAFEAKKEGDFIMYRIIAPAPSPYSDLPAQVDLTSGSISSLNVPLLTERVQPTIPDIGFVTGYDLEANTRTVVFGLTRGDTGVLGGLVYSTVGSDIVQIITTPIRVDRAFVIE